MPKAIHDEYDFGVELEEVCMDLLLADGTIRQPEGRLSNVMITVENCEIPVDFVVTEVKVKGDLSLAPIILGRPFLVTARTIMDWEKGTVEFKVGGETIKMDLSKMMKSPTRSGENIDFFKEEEEVASIQAYLLGVEDLYFEEDEPTPPTFSLEPSLELKPLPTSLKYAFLDLEHLKLVIISSSLTPSQEEDLLKVLREHEKALGWTFEDIRGIPSSICEHRIFLEEDSKPSRENQRRLNPHMREVLEKEILKWLEAGVIYAISDSQWVSPVHMVPKKSGITVEVNDKGEEI